jgi:hypothetical protein
VWIHDVSDIQYRRHIPLSSLGASIRLSRRRLISLYYFADIMPYTLIQSDLRGYSRRDIPDEMSIDEDIDVYLV